MGETPAPTLKSVLNIVKPVEQATPLEGILVVAKQTSGGSNTSWTLTDKNGYYELNNGLSTGIYQVTAGGYALLSKNETAGFVPTTKSGVTVKEADETVNTDFDLPGSAWISGKVTTSTGMPVFRALVTANSTTGGYSGFEYTDVEGKYGITTGLQANNYTVTVKYKDYSSTKSAMSVPAGADIKDINFQAVPASGGEIVGRVTDASTKLPIGGAVVRVTGSASAEMKTDLKGYYSFILGSGSYVVSTALPGFVANTTTVQVTANQVA